MEKYRLSEIKSFLDYKADLYENENFIENDPVSIPHLFSKKEDTERLVREIDLKVDSEFKLNDELTELFIKCEKIANKFLYDNSTQEETKHLRILLYMQSTTNLNILFDYTNTSCTSIPSIETFNTLSSVQFIRDV